jgi:tRNA (cytidine/uridine-2'-O-)-methyltransferase
MIHVVLYEPEIPPNTGNIIRLCANTGTQLHLIHPLGFELNDTRLQRAGLDYHEWADIREYRSLDEFINTVNPAKIHAVSTKGCRHYSDVDFTGDKDITLLFGPETRGLPVPVLEGMPPENILRIPMLATSRSLNLSNAVAVIVYEVLRQKNFPFNQGAFLSVMVTVTLRDT